MTSGGPQAEQLGLFEEGDVQSPGPAETPAPCRPFTSWWCGTEPVPSDERPGHLRYKSACKPCAWAGPVHSEENRAVEDAMDHAWPGWRTQPAMPAVPYGDHAVRGWLAEARRIYPPGWVDRGGPVRTLRGSAGTRHHDGTAWGGFNMAAGR